MTIITLYIFVYAAKWSGLLPNQVSLCLTSKDNKASIYLKGDGWIDNGKHHSVVVEDDN